MSFLEKVSEVEPALSSTVMVRKVHERFGVKVHPRSIERARRRSKKKRPEPH